MSETNKNDKLYNAIRNSSPDKADSIIDKYNKVRQSVGDDVLGYVDNMANFVIDKNGEDGVSDFEHELDLISQSMNLTASAEEIEINEKTKRAFDYFSQAFGSIDVPFDKDAYARIYMKTPEDFRPDIEAVQHSFSQVMAYADLSDFHAEAFRGMKNDLFAILGCYLNDDFARAETEVAKILDKVDIFALGNEVSQRLGVILDADLASLLIEGLKLVGFDADKIKSLAQEVGEVSGDYLGAVKGNESGLLSFLLESMVAMSDEKAGDGIKKQIESNATFKKIEMEVGKKVLEIQEKIAVNRAKLDEAKEGGKVQYNEKIAVLEKNLRVLDYNLLLQSKKLLVARIKNLGEKSPELERSLSILEDKLRVADFEIEVSAETKNSEMLRTTYDMLLKGQDVGEYRSSFLLNKLNAESQLLESVKQNDDQRVDASAVDFTKIEYTFLKDVPANEQERAADIAKSHFSVLKGKYLTLGKQLKVINLAGLILKGKKTPESNKDLESLLKKSAEVRTEIAEIKGSLEDVEAFLGEEKSAVPDVDLVSFSPLYAPLLSRAIDPSFAFVSTQAENLHGHLEGVMKVSQEFGEIAKNSDAYEENGGNILRLLKSGIAGFDKSIEVFEDSKAKVEQISRNFGIEIDAAKKGTHYLLKENPELKPVLIKMLEAAKESVDVLLASPQSPFATKVLADLIKGKKELVEGKAAFLSGKMKEIAVFSIVIATAVLGGISAATLFTRATARFFTAEALASGLGIKLAANLGSLAAGAVGGTLGSRIGMEATNAIKYSNFKNIWDAESFSDDALHAFLMSTLVVGVANGAVMGLSRGASSSSPVLARMSTSALEKLSALKAITSPYEFFRGMSGGKAVSSEIAKKFGFRYVTESGEEYVESGLEFSGHPVLGFIASLINAADGTNIETNFKLEGSKLSYGGSLESTVSNIEGSLAKMPDVSGFDMDIDSQGVITLNITKVGETKSVEIKVHPSEKTAKAPSMEFRGFESIDFNGTDFEIKDSSKVVDTLTGLKEAGFMIYGENGFAVARKGSFEKRIKLPDLDPAAKQSLENMSAAAKELMAAMDEINNAKEVTESMYLNLKLLALKASASLMSALSKLSNRVVDSKFMSSLSVFLGATMYSRPAEAGISDWVEHKWSQMGEFVEYAVSILVFIAVWKTLGFVIKTAKEVTQNGSSMIGIIDIDAWKMVGNGGKMKKLKDLEEKMKKFEVNGGMNKDADSWAISTDVQEAGKKLELLVDRAKELQKRSRLDLGPVKNEQLKELLSSLDILRGNTSFDDYEKSKEAADIKKFIDSFSPKELESMDPIKRRVVMSLIGILTVIMGIFLSYWGWRKAADIFAGDSSSKSSKSSESSESSESSDVPEVPMPALPPSPALPSSSPGGGGAAPQEGIQVIEPVGEGGPAAPEPAPAPSAPAKPAPAAPNAAPSSSGRTVTRPKTKL